MPTSEAQQNWYEQYAKNHPQPPAGSFMENAWTGEVTGSAPGMTYQEWQDTWHKYNSDRSKAYEEQFGEPEPVAYPISSGHSPSNSPEISTAPATSATTSPVYTPATDYTVPATTSTSAVTTPTANAPALPTGTNVAAATTADAPTYSGATTYGKKSKSPFTASGVWPVTNKKYPYKSSLFKTQTSELL